MSDHNLVFCPNCGRRNSLFGSTVTCSECGTVIERTGQGSYTYTGPTTSLQGGYPPTPPAAYTPPNPSPPPTIAPQPLPGVQTRGGCLPSLLVILVVLGLGYWGITRIAGNMPSVSLPNIPSMPALPTIQGLPPVQFPDIPIAADLNIHSVGMALPRDGSGADLLAFSIEYDSSASRSRYNLVYIEGDDSPRLRWTGPELSENAYRSLIAVDENRIFLADEDQLYAIERQDGSIAWQTQLIVDPACDECLRLVDERVIVFQKDGSLQGFDAESGELVWSNRFKSGPDALPMIAGQLVLLREIEGGNVGVQIEMIDPASGQTGRTIEPVCTLADSSFRQPLRYYGQLIPLLDGDSVLINYTSGSCIDLWDLSSGERVWRFMDEDREFPSTWTGEAYFITEDAFFFSNDTRLFRLDLSDGTLDTIYEDEEYSLEPIGVADDIVVVSVYPEWDSQRFALWGIDMQGERRWQFAVQGQDRMEFSSGDWEARVVPDGVFLIQALQDPRSVQVDLIDPDNGAGLQQHTMDLPGSGSLTLYRSIWLEDSLLIDVNGNPTMFSYTTGEALFSIE